MPSIALRVRRKADTSIDDTIVQLFISQTSVLIARVDRSQLIATTRKR